VIIGNPPWKEYSAVRKTYTIRNYFTETCGNLHGMCSERSLQIRNNSGWLSMIVQLPMVSSTRMTTVRSILRDSNKTIFVIPFDDRPGKLFEGLQNCRSVIFLAQGQNGNKQTDVSTARYQRWTTSARENLFPIIEFARLRDAPLISDLFPKYANETQETFFRKLKHKSNQSVASFSSRNSTDNYIFYQEATRYWIKATIGLPYYAKNGRVGAPAHGRSLFFNSSQAANPICALLNSSLFYLYFVAYGDCFHLSDALVSNFPVTKAIIEDSALATLNKKLMTNLEANSEIKTISTSEGNEISYAEFYASLSKPIIDQIDRVLAKHYGFTEEELDFIINYDIKYRMGRED
jgi:hypothetical protein